MPQLLQAGQQLGPTRFNRVDLYSVMPAKDGSGSAPGFYVHHFAYPQIDNVDNDATIVWNRNQAKDVRGDCDEPGDDHIDFQVGFANSRMISLQRNFYSYCHGTPHGYFHARSENVMLPDLHAATAEYIFGKPQTEWAKPLQDLFWKALSAQGWKPSGPALEDELKASILSPNRWLFTKDGLHYDFDAYEGGCYVCNPEAVTLPWESLKPLLAPGSAVP